MKGKKLSETLAFLLVASLSVTTAQAGGQETKESEGMELEGMFRYMADAALFRDCRTGKVFPVSMEGAYIELERAYLNSEIEGGKEAKVKLRGRYLERPPMEGDRNIVKLIVDSFETISPDETCEPTVHAELLNTYWKLVELGDKKVTTREGRREAHLILSAAEGRAHGNAGCNNYFGQYRLDGEELGFSAMGSTMMACPDGMDTERAFLDALGKADRFAIKGQFLELYHGEERLARFEAVYL
jgi:copper homeostasis protein (lipoprotein)